jgi:hypothetical protein
LATGVTALPGAGMIRRAVEFAAPVDGIDVEAERVLAQDVGLLGV